VYYDPDRQQIAMVGSDNTAAIHVYARSGAAWTAIDTGAGGPAYDDADDSIDSVIAAYDPSSHRLLAVGTHARVFPFAVSPFAPLIVPRPSSSRVWSMDATGAWTELDPLPTGLYDAAVAFDPAAAQLVVEDDGGNEWVYDGTAWTSSVSGFGAQVSLAVDP